MLAATSDELGKDFLLRLQRNADGVLSLLRRLEDGTLENQDTIFRDWFHLCLQSNDSDGAKVAYDHFSLVAATHDLLTFEALSHAAAIRPRNRAKVDFFRRCCGKTVVRRETNNLLRIGDSGRQELSLVSFYHRALDKYVQDHRSTLFPDASQRMFDACINYLGLEIFSKPAETRAELTMALDDFPFAAYAVSYWGVHAKEVTMNVENSRKIVEVLCDQKRLACIMQISWHTRTSPETTWDVNGGISPLHTCAFFGLEEICLILLQAGFHVDALDDIYQQTPLIYACRRGHDAVARLLLGKGADPNHLSALQRCPLLEAVEADEMVIFDLLLSQPKIEVNLQGSGPEARTALIRAAELGRSTMLRTLLANNDILVNKADSRDCTALSRAVQKLDISAIKALLERDDIDLAVKDSVGKRTALDWTAGDILDYGRLSQQIDETATVLLTDRRKPIVSNVALTITITQRRPQLLKLYLQHIPDFSYVDEHGQSFLHVAATAGDCGMLELVLEKLSEKRPYAIDTLDKYQATALHSACRHLSVGHIDVIKFLLLKNALATLKDQQGFTAPRRAFCAAPQLWNSHVKVLFDRLPPAELVYSDPTSTIDSMFRSGDLTSLQAFLKTAKDPLDPAVDAYTSYNFLHRIFEDDEQEEVVRLAFLELLLPRCKQILGAQTMYKQTCAHLAVLQNSLPCLQLLINASTDLDFVNVKDCYDMTSFETAQRFERDDMCVYLVKIGADLPAVEEIRPDLMHVAVQQKDLEAVTRLVEVGVSMYHRQKDSLLTPLQQAEEALRGAEEDFKHIILTKKDPLLFKSIDEWRKARDADPQFRKSEAIVDYLAEKQKWSEKPSHQHAEPAGLLRIREELIKADARVSVADFLRATASEHERSKSKAKANPEKIIAIRSQREKKRAMLELKLQEIELQKQMMELDIAEIDESVVDVTT